MSKIWGAVQIDVIKIFVPFEIKKRGGTAVVIMPKNADKENMEKILMIKSLGQLPRLTSGKWSFEQGKMPSLAKIARKEKVADSYVSKLFNLNFVAPKIIESILSGTQPRILKLQDLLNGKIPTLWQEQEELWGFGPS